MDEAQNLSLEALEARVGRLQQLLETHVIELDKRPKGQGEGFIDRLRELLLLERRRSDKLLIHYTALRAKYRDLAAKAGQDPRSGK